MLFFHCFLSEWIQQILFQQGALPVLLCLLESPDSEVQVKLDMIKAAFEFEQISQEAAADISDNFGEMIRVRIHSCQEPSTEFTDLGNQIPVFIILALGN